MFTTNKTTTSAMRSRLVALALGLVGLVGVVSCGTDTGSPRQVAPVPVRGEVRFGGSPQCWASSDHVVYDENGYGVGVEGTNGGYYVDCP